jgi:hypothetical protein
MTEREEDAEKEARLVDDFIDEFCEADFHSGPVLATGKYNRHELIQALAHRIMFLGSELDRENKANPVKGQLTVRELLKSARQYRKSGALDLDAPVWAFVFHDDDTEDAYPVTMVSAHAVTGEMGIYAQGDDPERN